jgi:hypothetical protein
LFNVPALPLVRFLPQCSDVDYSRADLFNERIAHARKNKAMRVFGDELPNNGCRFKI